MMPVRRNACRSWNCSWRLVTPACPEWPSIRDRRCRRFSCNGVLVGAVGLSAFAEAPSLKAERSPSASHAGEELSCGRQVEWLEAASIAPYGRTNASQQTQEPEQAQDHRALGTRRRVIRYRQLEAFVGSQRALVSVAADHQRLDVGAGGLERVHSLQDLWMLVAVDGALACKLHLGCDRGLPGALYPFVSDVFGRDCIDDPSSLGCGGCRGRNGDEVRTRILRDLHTVAQRCEFAVKAGLAAGLREEHAPQPARTASGVGLQFGLELVHDCLQDRVGENQACLTVDDRCGVDSGQGDDLALFLRVEAGKYERCRRVLSRQQR